MADQARKAGQSAALLRGNLPILNNHRKPGRCKNVISFPPKAGRCKVKNRRFVKMSEEPKKELAVITMAKELANLH